MKNRLLQILIVTSLTALLTFLFAKTGSQDIYGIVLYFFSILLIGFATYLIFKLNKATQAITAINVNLEQAVEDRTKKLENINAELKRNDINTNVLLHSMPDTIWRTTREGLFLDLITAKGQRPVVSPDDWRGKTIHDLLPPHVAERIMQAADTSFETGETQIFDFLLSNKDKVQYFEGRVIVAGGSEIVTIVRDNTEAKLAEAKTQFIIETIQGVSTTSNLKELLDHIYYSINRFLYSENCFVALFDAKTETLDMQYFVDKYDVVPPPGKLGRGLTGYVFRVGEPMLLTSTAIQQLIEDGEVDLIGTPPAVWLGVPLRTPKGVIGVFVVQHYDDSNVYDQRDLELLSSIGDQIAVAIDRKRAENEMYEAKNFLNRVIDNVPHLIYVKDTSGRYVLANNAFARLHGLDVKDVIGKTDEDLVGESEDVERYGASDRQVIESKREFINQEEKIVDAHGELRSLQSIKRPLMGNTGVEYILGIATDLTEWKNLENRLRHAQKLESIGQLAAGIAHEINTPTQYVGDNVRFLKDSFQDYSSVVGKTGELVDLCIRNEIQSKFLDEVVDAIESADMEYLETEVPKAFQQAMDGVQRISKIVQSMRDFAHPGSADKCAADLNKAIESTITVASNEWKYVADLVTDYDDNLPLVPCLIGEFNQVVLNMIVNAAHAIADVVGDGASGKGKITITTSRKDDWAEIRITDTGSGIPDHIIKKVFDPFFTTKEVGKGSGQGLAISHTVIIDKHKGTIDVESEVGKGTTFTIRLPLKEEQ